jgi:hypothetical protein
VNGCSVDDLRGMELKLKNGQDPATAMLTQSCQIEKFTGVDATTGYKRQNDITQALNLVKTPSSDVLNNFGLYIGASFIF